MNKYFWLGVLQGLSAAVCGALAALVIFLISQ